MDILVIDIETYPNPAMIEFLPQVQPDPRLKDQEKIAADIEKKQAEQVEKMALNPLYGQIACVGYYGEPVKGVELIDNEKFMIQNLLERCEQNTIFTWNGKGFDFEFVIKRGVILDACSLLDLEKFTDKYKAVNHIDLMEKWAGYNKYAKLDDVAWALLGEKKEEFDVKQIPELIKTKTGQELIKRYCLQDCKLVYDLARKMGF